MDKLKIVKTVVFLLTFLLIAGTSLLLGTLYRKTRASAGSEIASVALGQPHGSEIAQFKVINNEIYFLIKNGGNSDRLIIYDRSRDNVSAVLNLN